MSGTCQMSHRGRLHPGFRRFGHPPRRRISLQCQLGNLHWQDFHLRDHQLASLHYPGALTNIPIALIDPGQPIRVAKNVEVVIVSVVQIAVWVTLHVDLLQNRKGL